MNGRPKQKARRRKASAASRLRPFWILILLVLVAALGAGYFFATWPALRPHGVLVYGNRVVPSSEISAKAAVVPDTNVWLQNTHAMAKRVETIPYIGVASVHRRPPSAVIIDVTEREPYAVVAANGQYVIVDRDLRVLQQTGGPRFELPTMTIGTTKSSLDPGTFMEDATLRRLRADENMLVDAHVSPDALTTDHYGELVATLHSGVRLLLGDDEDLAKKIPLIDPILQQLQRANRPIAAIDLRAPGTPIVVYKK